MNRLRALIVTLSLLFSAIMAMIPAANAQELTLATVDRPPFSMQIDGVDTGFSIDLWNALADDLGYTTRIERTETFTEMLDLVTSGSVDAAAANISITAAREAVLDFSHPIYASGLQIMIPLEATGSPLLRALFSPDLLLAIAAAFAALLACGMLMWRFEHRAQEYFQGSAREKLFPAFWWALNLILNGGFEERVPRSPLGRIFGVTLVVSSLFFVSIFVASITASLTVDAIQSSVNSTNDLYDKRVGTTAGSTAASFLTNRDLQFRSFPDLDSLITAFEAGQLDAVVFDAPILAYYVNTSGRDLAQLAGPVLAPESYGIVLPTNSALAEQLNQSLLELREDGTYEAIREKWFGLR